MRSDDGFGLQDQNRDIPRQGRAAKNVSRGDHAEKSSAVKPDYLEPTHLLHTLGDYDHNSFVQFLTSLFPYDTEGRDAAVADYQIGTFEDWTSFPTISRQHRIVRGKLMRFDPVTGKRLKDRNGRSVISSLQYELQRAGRLKQDFETDKEVFFGEHLTAKYPTRPIGIVESEKSAVIASACKGAFPLEIVWIATGSKGTLKPERIARLGMDRMIALYPDAKAFNAWQAVAVEARRLGCDVTVSDLIETRTRPEQYAAGYDLADFLIAEQMKRNDPANRAAFAEMINERLAIMTIDGGLTEAEAEAALSESGWVNYAEQYVTGL